MGVKLPVRRLLAGSCVLVLALTVTPTIGAAAPHVCAKSSELAALNARVLQTELMVAALSCNQHERYNEFVTMFRGQLVGYGKTLKQLFARVHGASGNQQMNRFVTKLANDSSQRSLAVRDGYCMLAVELFDEVLHTAPRNFNMLTAKPWIRVRHGMRPCDGAVDTEQASVPK